MKSSTFCKGIGELGTKNAMPCTIGSDDVTAWEDFTLKLTFLMRPGI